MPKMPTSITYFSVHKEPNQLYLKAYPHSPPLAPQESCAISSKNTWNVSLSLHLTTSSEIIPSPISNLECGMRFGEGRGGRIRLENKSGKVA